MPSKRIKLENLTKELNKALKGLSDGELKRSEKALRATLVDVWGDVITRTPVDTGRVRGNWFVDDSFNPSRTGPANKRKGYNYINSKLRGGIFGKTKYLYNNLPYAKILEFGGYTKSPKKGTYNKKQKKYEVRSSGGYSLLAPRGMVRVSLSGFGAKLRKNIKVVK